MAASAVAPWAQPGTRQSWEHCGGGKGERPMSGRRGEMGSQADMSSKVGRPGRACLRGESQEGCVEVPQAWRWAHSSPGNRL